MSERTASERPVEIRGYKYIRLKSGRMLTFWEAIGDAESAHTDQMRAISRAFKLADSDYKLETLEDQIDRLEGYVGAIRQYIDKQRGNITRRERIRRLRNTTGRTPEEAALFRRKADELEAAPT